MLNVVLLLSARMPGECFHAKKVQRTNFTRDLSLKMFFQFLIKLFFSSCALLWWHAEMERFREKQFWRFFSLEIKWFSKRRFENWPTFSENGKVFVILGIRVFESVFQNDKNSNSELFKRSKCYKKYVIRKWLRKTAPERQAIWAIYKTTEWWITLEELTLLARPFSTNKLIDSHRK